MAIIELSDYTFAFCIPMKAGFIWKVLRNFMYEGTS